MWLSASLFAKHSQARSFPSTEKAFINESQFLKRSQQRRSASGGSPRYCGCPLPISCSVHLSHLNPKAPASAPTLRRRRPLVLPRGGAAHRNRFSARPVPQAGGGVLGGRAGRLGAGPQGAKPGGDSGPKHQGPGACGAPWLPLPLSSLKPEHWNLPYLGPCALWG